MGNYIFLQLSTIFMWGLMNILPIFGGYCLVKKITLNDSVFLRISTYIFIYLMQCGIIFSIIGVLKILSYTSCIIASGTVGFLFYYLSLKWDNKQTDNLHIADLKSICINSTWMERFFFLFTIAILINYIYRATLLSGTDTYLYHLYYPAMWISQGKIYSISLPGLPHEYFPVFGETLYGWNILCGTDTPFVGIVQLIAMLMALSACAALWDFYNVPKHIISISLFLIVSTGIIMENVCLCYTDCLTGSFLVTGICFLIISFKAEENFSTKNILFALFSGSAMGAAASIKYSGLVLAPIITLLLLIYFLINDIINKKIKNKKYLYITIICSACLMAGCYYLPNFIKTGNPFYPVKIPFIFPAGIDFQRETIELTNMWQFFVNENVWDMNLFSAIFYTIILIMSISIVFINKQHNSFKTFGFLAIILLLAEIFMLSIYPAMTQARQIIPFLSAVGILTAPILMYICHNKYYIYIFSVLFLLGILMLKNPLSANFIIFQCIGAIVCAFFALGKSLKYYKILGFFIGATTLFFFFFGSFQRWNSSLDLIKYYSSPTIYDGIYALRQDYKKYDDPLKIATVGTWFNYMFLMDMYRNTAEYIPISKNNTTHPHKFKNINDLRSDTVSFEEWRERLKKNKVTHLVIDLSSHQDFPINKKCELNWALAHPEHFQLITSDKNIYFFRIINN